MRAPGLSPTVFPASRRRHRVGWLTLAVALALPTLPAAAESTLSLDVPIAVVEGGIVTYALKLAPLGADTEAYWALPADGELTAFSVAPPEAGECVPGPRTLACQLAAPGGSAGALAQAAPIVTVTLRAPVLAPFPSRYLAVDVTLTPRAAAPAMVHARAGTAVVAAGAAADLAITGTTSLSSDGAGVTYALSVTNLGPAAAHQVMLSQSSGLRQGNLTSLSASQGTCRQPPTCSGNSCAVQVTSPLTVACSLGDLPAQSTANVTISATTGALGGPSGAGSVAGSATVSAADADPSSANNSVALSDPGQPFMPLQNHSGVVLVAGCASGAPGGGIDPVPPGLIIGAAWGLLRRRMAQLRLREWAILR